jgi:hypothetical protein
MNSEEVDVEVDYFKYLRRRMEHIQEQFAIIVSRPRIKPGRHEYEEKLLAAQPRTALFF